ncbi:MAG TPA: TonB-dependent receptor [Longimicrobiales bacterium]|nr:TonB-dependent receptor [Longimicrobiales bacterium]
MICRSALVLAALLAVAAAPAHAQQNPFVLDGLVVTASPSPRAVGEVGRSVTVLEGASLRAGGLTLVTDALRAVPGLSVVQGGSWGANTSVFLRGGESDHVLVLVDGVQVNQPGGAFDFAGLTLENVERIEVVRGPASSLYGSDAMAGVIHVITRSGRGAPRWEAGIRAGSFGRREASLQVGGGGGDSGWSFSLARFRTDGVLPRNNAFDNTVLSANVRLAPDAATRVGVALRVADRTYHFPTDGGGAVTDENALTFGDETSLAVNASRFLSDRVELRSTLSLARGTGGTDDRSDSPADTLGYYAFASLDQVERATADVRASARFGPLSSTVGAEVERQRQRSFSESLSQWGPSVGRSDHDRDNRAGYAHLTGSRGPFAFAGGVRAEDNERFGRSASWNMEAAWRVAGGTRVRASAGRGVKEPTFFENFAEGWVRGNPQLEPERARSVDAGVEQELVGGRVRLGVSAFHQRLLDLIQYVAHPAAPSDPNYVNVAEAVARGLEADAEVRWGALSGGVDWSWLATEVVRGGSDDGPDADFVPGSRLLRRPVHAVGVHGSFGWARASVRADARIVGERDDRDYSSWPTRRISLPRYSAVDVSVEVPVGRSRIVLRAENVLDERFEEVAGFRAPGRAVSLGGRFTFGGI